MVISSLDTHEIFKDLKGVGSTDEQAEAVTRAVKRTQDPDLSSLATKTDLNDLRAATNSDLAELRAANKADLTELSTDVMELCATTKTDLAELRSELIEWIVGVGFAQVAMILAVLRLFPDAYP